MSSEGILFTDFNGNKVSIFELSDGHRSVLSMMLDLCRQLKESETLLEFEKNKDALTVAGMGIVMIDEVDIHLHPTWQVRIGEWFVKYFPNIQFIVTTHSPLICQAADSIWKLGEPGTNEKARQIKGVEFKRLIYGNVLEAYGTGVFGEGVTRSEESHKMLERLARLNFRSIRGELNEEEKKELDELKAILPTQTE